MTSPTPTPASLSGLRAGAVNFVTALGHRWPTLLALGFAAINLTDLENGQTLAFILLFASVGYLVIAVIDRPSATWGVLLLMLAFVVLLRVLGVNEYAVLIGASVLLGLVGLIGGQLRRPGLYAVQPLGVLIFGGLAVVALNVSSDLGLYLVAAGLIGHAAWDVVHWRANKIVTRSLAEWCGVLDFTLGVGILILA